jgi:hypothetical protein
VKEGVKERPKSQERVNDRRIPETRSCGKTPDEPDDYEMIPLLRNAYSLSRSGIIEPIAISRLAEEQAPTRIPNIRCVVKFKNSAMRSGVYPHESGILARNSPSDVSATFFCSNIGSP